MQQLIHVTFCWGRFLVGGYFQQMAIESVLGFFSPHKVFFPFESYNVFVLPLCAFDHLGSVLTKELRTC